MNIAQLAALAEVAAPASPTSPGALYLAAVERGVLGDLVKLGPGLHADNLLGRAEGVLIGMTDAEVFAVFVDLGLWGEGLTTERAVIATGRKLGAAMVAAATREDWTRA